MSFSVTWTEAAEEQLADLWLKAADPKVVTAAVNSLELTLSRDPLAVGESRAGNVRLAFEPPLAILFRVDEAAGTVTVVSAGPS